jgi:hypothetical protein
VHFLSDQSEYYNVQLDQYIGLSQNPITELNAHGHKKNHPRGLQATEFYVNKFSQQPNDIICSMYPFPLYLNEAAQYIGDHADNLHIPENLSKAKAYVDNDYQQILDFSYERDFKLVFVSHDPRVALYHQSVRSFDRCTGTLDDVQQMFFGENIRKWEELNLTDVWDVRERMALNIHPMANLEFSADLTNPHYWVNCMDLWTRTDVIMKHIMDYVDLPIVQERWKQWLPICASWQKIQLDIVEFCYNQPHIVDAVVNNWYYEIDLTFQQEVIIQHYLIYQHGLNLRTWQLEKFPSNTQDLHKLLEPNIHPITKIY